MEKTNKTQKILLIFFCITFLVGAIFIITDTTPVVKINGEIHFALKQKLNLKGSYFDNELKPTSYYSNSDVKSLRKMKLVKELSINCTNITDLSFLADMKSLEKLTYNGRPMYPVSDWKPLAKCNKLVYLNIINSDIPDLSSFKELINLKVLSVGIDQYAKDKYGFFAKAENTAITDISDVKYLVNLESLHINGKEIRDISALKYCDNLMSLSLYGTKTSDYSVLLEISELERLNIDKGVLTKAQLSELRSRGVEVREVAKTDEEN